MLQSLAQQLALHEHGLYGALGLALTLTLALALTLTLTLTLALALTLHYISTAFMVRCLSLRPKA